jgi:hypothetical protein
MMLRAILVLMCVVGCYSVADAQYVLVLKNGRQITVQSYREDGAVIRFSGLGGEMAINKDQVQAIRRANESERKAVSAGPERPSAAPPGPVSSPASESAQTKPAPAPEPTSADTRIERAEEEQAYHRKLKELNEQLKELRDRYALLTRGNTGPEPKLFTTEEEFRGHQEDLLSRLRDAQYRSQGLPSGANATSPPFSLNPPPAYSDKQKELSELRRRMTDVENARQRLIDEMKIKNFETGSLFLD